MQPFAPAPRLADQPLQHPGHARGHRHRAFLQLAAFEQLQLGQRVVFAHRELRTHIGGAHAAEGILLGIAHPVGIVALDETAVGAYLVRQHTRHSGIERRGMQVGPHLAHDEAGPYVLQPGLLQSGFQLREERVEGLLVGQSAVHLLGSHLVGDGRQSAFAAEPLDMGDQLDGAGDHQMDADDLPLRHENIHRGIDVDQVVTGQHGGFERPLHAVHGLLGRPALDGLPVLEPRTAVVDGDDGRTRIMDGLGLETRHAYEVGRRHPRIASVHVDLVQGRGEIDRGVVAACGAECGLRHGHRIGAHSEDGAGNPRLAGDPADGFEQLFGFFHSDSGKSVVLSFVRIDRDSLHDTVDIA